MPRLAKAPTRSIAAPQLAAALAAARTAKCSVLVSNAGLATGDVTGLTDPDDVPEVPTEPVSKLGDVWVLGSHRLLCGDSTSAKDVKAVLGSVRPHLMVTDLRRRIRPRLASGRQQMEGLKRQDWRQGDGPRQQRRLG